MKIIIQLTISIIRKTRGQRPLPGFSKPNVSDFSKQCKTDLSNIIQSHFQLISQCQAKNQQAERDHY